MEFLSQDCIHLGHTAELGVLLVPEPLPDIRAHPFLTCGWEMQGWGWGIPVTGVGGGPVFCGVYVSMLWVRVFTWNLDDYFLALFGGC